MKKGRERREIEKLTKAISTGLTSLGTTSSDGSIRESTSETGRPVGDGVVESESSTSVVDDVESLRRLVLELEGRGVGSSGLGRKTRERFDQISRRKQRREGRALTQG